MAHDLALDATTHDLVLTSNNGLLLIDNAERVSQQIKVTLLTFKGEWFLDILFGIPYLEQIMIKNPALSLIRTILRRKILEVPDVSSVNRIALYFNRQKRELTVEYEAGTLFGVVTSREVLGYGSI